MDLPVKLEDDSKRVRRKMTPNKVIAPRSMATRSSDLPCWNNFICYFWIAKSNQKLPLRCSLIPLFATKVSTTTLLLLLLISSWFLLQKSRSQFAECLSILLIVVRLVRTIYCLDLPVKPEDDLIKEWAGRWHPIKSSLPAAWRRGQAIFRVETTSYVTFG